MNNQQYARKKAADQFVSSLETALATGDTSLAQRRKIEYDYMNLIQNNGFTAKESNDGGFWLNPDTFSKYPTFLFSDKQELNTDKVQYFPRDDALFTHMVNTNRQSIINWRLVLQQLQEENVLVRKNVDVSRAEIDTVIIPIVYHSIQPILNNANPNMDEQTGEFLKALVQKTVFQRFDTLVYHLYDFNRLAANLCVLYRELNQLRKQEDLNRLTMVRDNIEDQLYEMSKQLVVTKEKYQNALKQYQQAYAKEISYSKKVVTFLTNYLSGSIFYNAHLGPIPLYKIEHSRELVKRILDIVGSSYLDLVNSLANRNYLHNLVNELIASPEEEALRTGFLRSYVRPVKK